ncbi:hypothetical protein KKHLCK_02760 [Candidatus Electrothrix laxa]
MLTKLYLMLAACFVMVMLSACANMSERERIYSEAIVVGTGIGTGMGAAASCVENRATYYTALERETEREVRTKQELEEARQDYERLRENGKNIVRTYRPIIRTYSPVIRSSSPVVRTYSPAHNIPQFPWPPPHPSAYSVIPSRLLPNLTNQNHLKDVAKKLEAAFDQAGYSQKKYYQVSDGFALISQLEQFDPDGTPRTPPDRWAADFRPPKIFSLSSYLKALFTANPGRYRIIAFIVTSQPFKESKETVTREEAMSWLDDGMIVLPESIGKQPYTEKHYCTAFIYEFEQPGKEKEPFFRPLSNLTGKDHLEKSKLWAALKQ